MIPEAVRLRYAEPHRRYHTVRHLRAVLAALHRWLGPTLPEPLYEAALWHDAVYDPRASDNEAQSAVLTDNPRAKLLILSTQRHEPVDSEPDALALLDADLWILGAPPRTYDRYAQLIREEYAFVAEDDFRRGRAAVVERFLARPRLYFRDAPEREAQARANLSRELSHQRA